MSTFQKILWGILLLAVMVVLRMGSSHFVQKKEKENELQLSEMKDLLNEQEKKYEKEHIYELVKAKADHYRQKKMGLGGIGEASVSVVNHSRYVLDLIIVDVQYKNRKGKVQKSEKLTFQHVPAGSMMQQYAPDSKRGTELECIVSMVKSTELGL